MIIDVIICDKNLNQDGRLNLSSIKPTMANGMQQINIYCFEINPYNTEKRTNIRPPLVGVGKMCELLLLGVSSLYLPKNGIKILYEIKENIVLSKNCKRFKPTPSYNLYYVYLYKYVPFAILK